MYYHCNSLFRYAKVYLPSFCLLAQSGEVLLEFLAIKIAFDYPKDLNIISKLEDFSDCFHVWVTEKIID